MTRSDMRSRIIRIATNLQNMGIKKGDIITIFFGTQHENLLPLIVGIFLIGAVVNPMDVALKQGTCVICDNYVFLL